MLPEDLLKKVRRIELSTRRLVSESMSSQYKSNFKGAGVQFSEHRIYLPGDDVRHIDWKVSARTRDPLIKLFEEERELTLFLAVDVSGSENFGSHSKLKSEIAAELAGMIAFAAIQAGDKVGMLLFSDQIEKILPPKKGRQHVLRMISEILSFKPKSKRTDLKLAIESIKRMMKHQGIVFLLSDFIAENFEIPLKQLSRKNDVIAIETRDPREFEPMSDGVFCFKDPETDEEYYIHSGSYRFKKWIEEWSIQQKEKLGKIFLRAKVDHLIVKTSEDYGEAMVRFFQKRKKRKSR